MNNPTGKYIVFFGIIIVAIGLLVYFFSDKFNWLGRLPGDIRVERKIFRFYFPITTMIIVSVLLTILLRIFKRFL